MKVDESKSIYHEASEASKEFSRAELKSLRVLLRRLRFLEHHVRENGGLASGSGGAAFAEWEQDALVFVLVELGYLQEPETAQ